MNYSVIFFLKLRTNIRFGCLLTVFAKLTSVHDRKKITRMRTFMQSFITWRKNVMLQWLIKRKYARHSVSACHYTAGQSKKYRCNTIKGQGVCHSCVCEQHTLCYRSIVLLPENKHSPFSPSREEAVTNSIPVTAGNTLYDNTGHKSVVLRQSPQSIWGQPWWEWVPAAGRTTCTNQLLLIVTCRFRQGDQNQFKSNLAWHFNPKQLALHL